MEPSITERYVWVIAWRYSDGSASGVARAYASEKRGLHDLDLLNALTVSQDYELVKVPIYE